MDDVVVEPTGEPTYQRVTGRVIGRCCEDVKDAVVEFAAIRGKVGAVDGVRGLEYQGYRQTNDQMEQKEGSGYEQR